MKFLYIIMLLINMLATQVILAQRFTGAILAGLSTNQIDGDTQKDYKKPGIFAGVSVETELNQLFGAKIELFYITKGAKKTVDQIEEFNTSLYYIEMPFLLSIKPIKQGQLDVGLAGSYLIGSKLVNYGETVADGLYDMRHFDFSAQVSVIYYFTQKMGFNARFNYSLVPVKNNPNWFNNNLSFGLIYKFN